MDRGRRALRALNDSRRHISFSGGKKNAQLKFAEQELKKLDEIVVDNPSTLIRYRQNFTVPAVWVPQQGIRISNIPQIPPEKIENLDTYIQANVGRIDGGNIEGD